MATQTTEEMISSIREYTEKLKAIPGVTGASINDWGRFGNFDVFYHINPSKSNIDLGRMNREAKKLLKEIAPNAKVRRIFSPKRKYNNGSFDRYDLDTISIDIDFMDYSPGTNSFSKAG